MQNNTEMFKIPLVNVTFEIYLERTFANQKKMEALWKKRNSLPLYRQILI